jgi:uncharacterized membrane protein YdjX (TVP38/TMEM64 family)
MAWIGLAVVAVGLLALGGRSLGALVPVITARVEEFGVLAPLAFIGFCALAEVAFVPGSLLTLAAGAMFGVVYGALVAMLGATLGAAAAFLAARHGLRRFVEPRVRASPRLGALDRALEREGRKVVFLVRLTPLIPFNVLNYALGVTRVRFRDYLIGSVGMLPGSLLYASYGKIAGDAVRVSAGVMPARGAGYYVLLGAGVLATLAVTLILSRAARRALSDLTSTASP